MSQDETIAQPAMEGSACKTSQCSLNLFILVHVCIYVCVCVWCAVSCAFANQFSTTDLPRKLMQRTMQMVRLSSIMLQVYKCTCTYIVHLSHWTMHVNQVMATQSFSVSLPYLTFLGRLLHSLPPLCREITHSFGIYTCMYMYVNIIFHQSHQKNTSLLHDNIIICLIEGGFLEYLLSGLAYPDENIKSAVVYILAQLSMKTPQNSLPTSLVHSLCHSISSSLASAKSHNLTLNLLGIN